MSKLGWASAWEYTLSAKVERVRRFPPTIKERHVAINGSRDTTPISPGHVSFTQLDITESFGDDARLGPEDWVAAVPLNEQTPKPQARGLPAVGTVEDEVYEIASRLSQLRESIPVPNDGVYCPICHIANTELTRLRTPCPQCGRALLKFGWD